MVQLPEQLNLPQRGHGGQDGHVAIAVGLYNLDGHALARGAEAVGQDAGVDTLPPHGVHVVLAYPIVHIAVRALAQLAHIFDLLL